MSYKTKTLFIIAIIILALLISTAIILALLISTLFILIVSNLAALSLLFHLILLYFIDLVISYRLLLAKVIIINCFIYK